MRPLPTYFVFNNVLFVDNLCTSLFSSRIVLVAAQDEAKRRMTSTAKQALSQIGATSQVTDYRGTMAMVGYTGTIRPKYVKTVRYFV